MKIAIAGKGGVGKTTLAAGFCVFLARRGYQVYAVDADPDVSLGVALGFPSWLLDSLQPLIEMKDLVEERTGGGAYLVLNPQVDDLVARYACRHENISLLRMGGIKPGGSECYCKESSFLRAVLGSLLLGEEDVVVLDMGAGIEGLTRGTARGVDLLVVVAEPTPVSFRTARVITSLAGDLGIARIGTVVNKVRNQAERDFIAASGEGLQVLGCLSYDEEVLDRALAGGDGPPAVLAGRLYADLEGVGARILKLAEGG